MLKLPIGVQSFEKLRLQGYCYVDKTKQLYQLISEGGAYFLTRPRRFGKSLLISTLFSLFRGDQHLFKGLSIDSSGYDWKKFPVVRLDFSRLVSSTEESLIETLHVLLNKVADEYQIQRLTIEHALPSIKLTLLFQTGYLSIDRYDEKSRTYELKFPNEEVRRSFLESLLSSFDSLTCSLKEWKVLKN